jgi:hypothetical protein
MRRTGTTALTLLFGWMLLSGVAGAQATARNTVTVHIPSVLRLSIDQGTASDSQTLDVTVGGIVDGTFDGTLVNPGRVTVKVFANTQWVLSIEDGSRSAPTLRVCTTYLGLEGCHPLDPTVKFATQQPTGGWKDIPLTFSVNSPVATATTHTLTFTLSRP